MKQVLIATEKPFSKVAVEGIRTVIEQAGYELKVLENYKTKQELLEAVAEVDALIVRSDKVDKEVIEAASKLKIVVRAGAGYDNLDLENCSAKHVIAMNTPGQNSNAVAELVFGMLVFGVRNHFNGSSGSELRGKSLGIHAYGNVGHFVGQVALGFGMKVYAYDPYVTADRMESDGIEPVNSIEELYRTCEVISLHIPATESTIKSINKPLLMMMPKGAVLINTARKEVINEEDLVEVMNERDDFIYLSDIIPSNAEVFKTKFPNRHFFTPKKMGAQTEEANVNAGVAAARQIVSFFTSGDETFRINR